MPDISGVYLIICDATGKRYVGSSVRIRRRWSQHRSLLNSARHNSRHLQSAWLKHREAAFSFSVIEECPPAALVEREQHYVDTLSPEFNLTRDVRARIGPEARALITAASRARAEARTACPAGHPYTSENTYFGNIKGERRCRQCNADKVAAIYARETTDQREHRRRRAKAYHDRTKMLSGIKPGWLSRGRVIPTEQRAQISAALKGRKQTPGAIERRRAGLIGRIMTLETRAKLSAIHKAKALERGHPTHCVHGHFYDEANTIRERPGKISCRTCRNDRKRAKRAAARMMCVEVGV